MLPLHTLPTDDHERLYEMYRVMSTRRLMDLRYGFLVDRARTSAAQTQVFCTERIRAIDVVLEERWPAPEGA